MQIITTLVCKSPGITSLETSTTINGTSMRVYRLLYKQGKPVGVHEVQKKLNLSSPSVAHYHLRKLVDEGYIREESEGYVVDKILFENMIRVGGSVIPFQTTLFLAFLGALILLLTIFRSPSLSV